MIWFLLGAGAGGIVGSVIVSIIWHRSWKSERQMSIEWSQLVRRCQAENKLLTERVTVLEQERVDEDD